MNIDNDFMKAVLQGMIFVSETPVTLKQMLAKLNAVYRKQNPEADVLVADQTVAVTLAEPAATDVDAESVNTTDDADASEGLPTADLPITTIHVKNWLKEIEETYQSAAHGFELVYVAKGYQFRTKIDIAIALQSDKKTLPSRLSASAMETLAIVAYEQPVARGKIDDVRGVDSGGVLKTLLEKDFLRIVGRADEPGQPLLYGTTSKFLEVFNLKNLKDMPSLAEIKDLYLKADEEAADEPAQYFDPDEVLEQRATALSDEESELMGELDDSLKSLKDVEQSLEFFKDGGEG